jgi:hypothetical protein
MTDTALTTEQRHAALRGPPNPRAQGHSPSRDHWEEVAARARGGARPDSNEIPGFDKMSFAQQRFAQDQIAARRR